MKNQDSASKLTPFSSNVEKVYESLVIRNGRGGTSLPSYLKYSISDGELRVQNNIWGTLFRAKPDKDGIWKVRGWLTGYNCSGWQNIEIADFVLLVAEVTEPSLCVEVSGDYLEDSDEAYYNVTSSIDNIMYNAAHNRDRKILYQRIPGLVLESAGGSSPYQSDGTWNEWSFYFRYRHGWASLVVGKDFGGEGEDSVLNLIQNPYWSAGVEYPSEDDGDLTVEQFTNLFCELWKILESLPFKYEFRQLTQAEKDISAWVSGWDAKQAWSTIKDFSFYKDNKYELTPVTEDCRIYPWPIQKFIVLDYKP